MSTVPERAPVDPAALQALGPVRDWLVETARRDADTVLARARTEAEERLARARAGAAELVTAARAEGAAQGAEAAARELARARREARASVLRAQTELQEQLRVQAREAVSALRSDAGYPALREQLAARAVAALGPGASVTEAPSGGVEARTGGRRVDLSLAVLADRALARLGAEVTRLWT